MKPLISKCSNDVTILDPSMTFGNIRFPRPTTENTALVSNDKSKNFGQNLTQAKFITDLYPKNIKNKFKKFRLSDKDSKISSISKYHSKFVNFKRSYVKTQPDFSCTDNTNSVFTSFEDGVCESYDEINSALSISSKQFESDKSFFPVENYDRHMYDFINPKEDNLNFIRPLRLFNKNGKPLTDRLGRPLLNIHGEPLVVYNSSGRIISDSNGNQVFNSLGESAIYSTTNLHIPPTENEPGCPVMVVDKKHILFLYDNKGHPLTDFLGRPLTKASGRLMFGMNNEGKININNYKDYQLKNIYSKAPFENFVRRVQIFDSALQPITDEYGSPIGNKTLICNRNGMPVCDINGQQLYFKYGARIIANQQEKNTINSFVAPETHKDVFNTPSLTSDGSSKENYIANKSNKTIGGAYSNTRNCDYLHSQEEIDLKGSLKCEDNDSRTAAENFTDTVEKHYNSNSEIIDVINSKTKNRSSNHRSNKLLLEDPQIIKSKHQQIIEKTVEQFRDESLDFRGLKCNGKDVVDSEQNQNIIETNNKIVQKKKNSEEAVVLFDASKKMDKQKPSICTISINHFKGRRISHIVKKTRNRKLYTSNFIEYFKNALNLSALKQNDNRMIFNDYGKPIKDIYGNLLYDKFGIPLTGAHGIKLSEKARHALRLKLRNIPVLPVNKNDSQNTRHAPSFNQSYDQFGDPFYDKYGRPLYDLFGKLIYDFYGRPLTDAFGRPLIDAIGQPLMDSDGNVLTSVSNSPTNTLTDIFSRRLYDRRGRPLFDSYGRPRYDIFTNAMYDSFGRPVKDGNGNILFDFLNKPIQPHSEKPLYKNARALLPKYIDRILAMPSMHRVLKYSRTTLKDVFGGPLFDDFGRPLYNKLGMPLYDKYGRPLYDKDGKPLCDCYGRPLSEEIKESPDDQTLSVVDSLKLLKLTKESSKWMEIKKSQSSRLQSSDSGILDDAIVMRVVQPAKHKTTQYTYALTRVTRFSCGRQALEILEAPLSPSTASEMHHLPVDNKPLIMVARRRQRIIKKYRHLKRP